MVCSSSIEIERGNSGFVKKHTWYIYVATDHWHNIYKKQTDILDEHKILNNEFITILNPKNKKQEEMTKQSRQGTKKKTKGLK